MRIIYLFNSLLSISLSKKLKKVNGIARFQYPVTAIGFDKIIIGKNFDSGKNLRIQAISRYQKETFEPEIVIGDDVTINPNCQLVVINKLVIGNNVLIASNVFISDHSHGCSNFSDIDTPPSLRKLSSKGSIVIDDNVWIGQNVSILANVKIGKNSIIGANSVVTKSIPDFSIAVGIPASVIKNVKPNVNIIDQ
ncbi:acyltransferase [Flavobacterium granuli]|uniref:Acetyltransferase-like isoleucine patch superfamily enzyme n=1 Tax=Flavobacterium granuli TaxID=280093 RepID=A0ABU1S813_9FLAO|nr:acyltransferase [Flavobacterium granuli]MDR6846394.1 acetyltransferase-like isoleucine patch superfamily enzyme [Flavobacterium granuli]